MKKIQLSSKLQLNKEKITSLTQNEMGQVNGGFTYSLSTGARCQESKKVGADNPYECGIILASSERCKQLTVIDNGQIAQ